MVTYSEDDLSRLLIRTYHVDAVWLLNRHLSPANLQRKRILAHFDSPVLVRQTSGNAPYQMG